MVIQIIIIMEIQIIIMEMQIIIIIIIIIKEIQIIIINLERHNFTNNLNFKQPSFK